MKKTITISRIIQMLNDLNEYDSKRLPQKISYAIAKNAISLTTEYDFYTNQLGKLIDDFISNDKVQKDSDEKIVLDGSGVPIPKQEHQQEFNECVLELLNCEVEMEFYLVSDEIFNYEDSNRFDAMSPLDIVRLKRIICAN